MGGLFDLDRLDDTDPFEIDRQAAHLFKHDPYGIDDIYDLELRPAVLPGQTASALADGRGDRG